MLSGAVGRSAPGVKRVPRLPLPPPRLVVCSHAALLRGPPPRCVSCAGPPRRFSSLVLCLSSARAQFGSCGLLLLASAGLLGVQRPGCVLARGAAPRPAPSLRLPRVAASSFCSACFRCGLRAAGALRVVRFVCQARFFLTAAFKILGWLHSPRCISETQPTENPCLTRGPLKGGGIVFAIWLCFAPNQHVMGG